MTPRFRPLSLPVVLTTLTTLATLVTTAAYSLFPTSAVAQSSAPTLGTSQQLSSQLAGGSASYNLIHRSITLAGLNREYHVALPAFFTPSGSYPVIIGFGGWDHDALQFRDYAGLEQAARGEAIIIYAQGINDAWAGAPYASTTMSQDIDYVRAAINDVISNYSGDADRIYATGLSNGGGMAAALGCHAPGLVDAIASIAGAHYTPTVTGCQPGQVPTLLMHGTHDDAIAYGGGTRHGATYQGAHSTFDSVAWRNGCTASTRQTSDYHGTTTFRPHYCTTATELVRVNGGGHTWFTDPRAADVVWDFLVRQG